MAAVANNPKFAKSLNTSPSLQSKRMISPDEGKSAVNGRAGDDVKKMVAKVRPRVKEISAGVGAIEQPTKTQPGKPQEKPQQRRCSACGKPGHTKRTCGRPR